MSSPALVCLSLRWLDTLLFQLTNDLLELPLILAEACKTLCCQAIIRTFCAIAANTRTVSAMLHEAATLAFCKHTLRAGIQLGLCNI